MSQCENIHGGVRQRCKLGAVRGTYLRYLATLKLTSRGTVSSEGLTIYGIIESRKSGVLRRVKIVAYYEYCIE